MEHIKDTEWHEFTAGSCTAQRAAWIDAHLQECPACRSRMAEFQTVFGLLDNWQVDTSGHEVADKVINAVNRPLRFEAKSIRPLHRRFVAWASQIAAAVLIGLALGHLAGRISANDHIAQQQNTAIQSQPGYLAALDLQFASDLTWSVLEDEQPDQEAEK